MISHGVKESCTSVGGYWLLKHFDETNETKVGYVVLHHLAKTLKLGNSLGLELRYSGLNTRIKSGVERRSEKRRSAPFRWGGELALQTAVCALF